MDVLTSLATVVGPVGLVLSYSSGKWGNLARTAFNVTSNTQILYCSVTLNLGSDFFFPETIPQLLVSLLSQQEEAW